MKLYKYCPPERIDILQNKRLSFSLPSNFNDPFDCLPSFKESEVLNPIGQRIYMEQVDPEDMFDEAKKDKMHKEFQAHITKSLEVDPSFTIDSIAQIPRMPNKESEAAFITAFRSQGQGCGQSNKLILSLSAERKNLLMWAHYAAEHTGFMISLDAQHSYFNPEGDHPMTAGKIHEVVYTSQRPTGIYGTLPLRDSLLSKSLDWLSEKEWRVIQDVKNVSHTIEIKDKKIYLFDIPPQCISEVILGCRCPQSVKEEITNIISSNEEWSHVKLLNATTDEKKYQLNYV